jgi:hypothetical protein
MLLTVLGVGFALAAYGMIMDRIEHREEGNDRKESKVSSLPDHPDSTRAAHSR